MNVRNSILALICLVPLCLSCWYRGVAQPITVDEAHIYLEYIRHRPFFGILDTRYNTANHVLQTALSYGTVHAFGPSELALRLPALLAAPFYFFAIWRLAFRSFRRRGFIFLALGLMALNPLVLDYLSLARGYGIGLSMLAWSLYLSLQYLHEGNPRLLISAGALLGLSIAANLTFAIPASGLALMVLLAIPIGRALPYLGPAVLCALMFLALPLSSASSSDFYYGQPDVVHSLVNMTETSLFYHGRMPLFSEWTQSYRFLIGRASCWGAPIALLVIGLVWMATFRTAHVLSLAGGSLFVSVAVLLIGHWTIDLKYPYDRTGLYLLFLFPLVFLAAMNALFDRPGLRRWVAASGIAVMAAVLAIYCLEFHTGNFAEWPFAPDVDRYVEIMRTRSPAGSIRIGGSVVFAYLVDFYREKHHATWLAASNYSASLAAGFDYYMLLPEDREYVSALQLRILCETGESILAAPR